MSEVTMTKRVVVHEDDGTQTDITEGVQVLYDNLMSSMDWGSGFLDDREARTILEVAVAAGFTVPDDAKAKFEEYLRGQVTTCRACGGRAVYKYSAGPPGWYHVDERPVYVQLSVGAFWRNELVPAEADHVPTLW